MRSMTHLVAAPFLCIMCALLSVGCGGPTEPLPERQDATPEELLVAEPIDFTPTNYEPALNGPNTIAELRGLIDAGAFVWHGFSPDNPYPVTGDCEPERNNDQMTTEVSGLPMTIRGVVTLYPRYFVKPSICGSDERYYGSFFIQDGSGGMMVLRDSRTAGFTFGDVVELRVKGLMKFFDYDAILSFDNLRVVTDEYVSSDDVNGKKDIYVQEITRRFMGTDQGSVMRVTGVITQEATNNNFNEMRLTSPDGSTIWIISLDREIGQRNPDWKLGDTLEVTGPVLNSFGLKIIVMSYGQVNKLSSAMGGN